jgi:hypothetical protein
MKVTLVRTEGPGREAILKIEGTDYCVRDGFSWLAERTPPDGGDLEVSLSTVLDDSWSWEDMFAANPDRRIGLEPVEGYSYLAFGRILSIDPVRIDYGLLVEERALYTHDPRVVGDFVGFRIPVLDAEG